MSNRGYVNAHAVLSIDTTKHKKAALTYNITANEPYRICNYHSTVSDPKADSIIHLAPPTRTFFKSLFRSTPKEYISYVKEGMLFDRNMLD